MKVVPPRSSVHHPGVEEDGAIEHATCTSLCFGELLKKLLDSTSDLVA